MAAVFANTLRTRHAAERCLMLWLLLRQLHELFTDPNVVSLLKQAVATKLKQGRRL